LARVNFSLAVCETRVRALSAESPGRTNEVSQPSMTKDAEHTVPAQLHLRQYAKPRGPLVSIRGEARHRKSGDTHKLECQEARSMAANVRAQMTRGARRVMLNLEYITIGSRGPVSPWQTLKWCRPVRDRYRTCGRSRGRSFHFLLARGNVPSGARKRAGRTYMPAGHRCLQEYCCEVVDVLAGVAWTTDSDRSPSL